VTLPTTLDAEKKAVCKDQPGSTPGTDASGKQAVCIYDTKPLTKADSINDLKGPERDKYFYDPSTGMLYFNVIQDLPNPHGPSPLGSCSDPPNMATDDPSCPDVGNGESYYACPAAGCPHYVVKLLNSNNQIDTAYQPGRSRLADGTTTCKPYPTYLQNEPLNQNVLVLVGDTTNTPIVIKDNVTKPKFPHHEPKNAVDTPICKIITTVTTEAEEGGEAAQP
jgi:hypothetical protein